MTDAGSASVWIWINLDWLIGALAVLPILTLILGLLTTFSLKNSIAVEEHLTVHMPPVELTSQNCYLFEG